MTPGRFTFTGLPTRVVFGAGTFASLRAEVDALAITRALVVATPGQHALAGRAAELLGAVAAAICDRAVVHVPIEVAEAGRAAAATARADGLVAVGGGSAIGLAKAIAMTTGLPILAVPTTFSGSEMTPVFGLTEGAVKRTGRDPRVLPRTVIYDPALLHALPAAVAGPSAINALAHCVEALYAPDANPVTSLLAEDGARALAASAGRADARAETLRGSWLAGSCLGSVAMGMHHKLCHTLGGTFNLPHAETHAIVLPHVVAFNAPAAPNMVAALARAFGVAPSAVPGAIFDLAATVGAPTALSAIGMPRDGLARAASLATEQRYANPRPITTADVLSLLEAAYVGRRP